jgi:hypothetical protein
MLISNIEIAAATNKERKGTGYEMYSECFTNIPASGERFSSWAEHPAD